MAENSTPAANATLVSPGEDRAVVRRGRRGRYAPVVMLSVGFVVMTGAAAVLPAFTMSMRYPITAAILNLIFPLSHMLILVSAGHMTAFLVLPEQHRRFSLDVTGGYTYVDAILLGLGLSIAIGVIAGLLGVLSPLCYPLVCVAISIAYSWKTRCAPPRPMACGGPVSWVAAIVVSAVVVFFCFHQLTEDAITKSNADFHVQYLPQIRALAESGRLVPSPYSLENKIHEYYYSILMSAPAFDPRLLPVLPFLHVGLQVLGILVVFEAAKRLFGAPVALASAGYLLAMLTAMTFLEHNFTPLKSALRFLLLGIGVSAAYTLLYLKSKNPLHLIIAVVFTSLLAGTTIVGFCYAMVTTGVIVFSFITKRLSARVAIAAALTIALGWGVPKLVNLHHTGSCIDYISATLLGLPADVMSPLPQYGSALDTAIHELWFGVGSETHRLELRLSVALQAGLRAGGWLLLMAMFANMLQIRSSVQNAAAVVYAFAALPVLYYCTAIVMRQSIFILPWAALAFGSCAHLLTTTLDKWVTIRGMPPRVARCLRVSLLLLLLLAALVPDVRFAFGSMVKSPKREVQRCCQAAARVRRIGTFLRSQEFETSKKLFRQGEAVIDFGNLRFPHYNIADYYGYTAVQYTNIINAALFCDTPEASARALRQLGVRYVLINHRSLLLPKPALFFPGRAGCFLRVVRRGPLFPNLGDQRSPECEAEEVLLEILSHPTSVPDPEVSRTLSSYEYRECRKTLRALESLSGELNAMTEVVSPVTGSGDTARREAHE